MLVLSAAVLLIEKIGGERPSLAAYCAEIDYACEYRFAALSTSTAALSTTENALVRSQTDVQLA